MRSFDRCAPLGPYQPVEAVARADVRAAALPALDDPREAGLQGQGATESFWCPWGRDFSSGVDVATVCLACAIEVEGTGSSGNQHPRLRQNMFTEASDC